MLVDDPRGGVERCTQQIFSTTNLSLMRHGIETMSNFWENYFLNDIRVRFHKKIFTPYNTTKAKVELASIYII